MSAEEIFEKLKSSFQTPSRKDERLKVVLICIVISTTFWFFSALNKTDYVSEIKYPIELLYDTEEYVATKPLPEKLTLEVSGGGWDLMARFFGFGMETLQIPIENPDTKPFVLVNALRSDLSSSLEPVMINFIPNDSIKFEIQRRVNKKVALLVDQAAINLDPDYRMATDPVISPDSIVLIGPEATLQSINELRIMPSDRQVDADYSSSVGIPELPQFVSSELSEVNLSFDVVRYLKVTERYKIEKRNFPIEAYDIEPSEVNVSFEISELVFDVQDSSEIRLWVDYNNFDPSDSTVFIEVEKGYEKMDNVTFSPVRVKVVQND